MSWRDLDRKLPRVNRAKAEVTSAKGMTVDNLLENVSYGLFINHEKNRKPDNQKKNQN
ncbi:hypothetical protein LBMAG09_03180 [Actinomycetes bacterium]|nr:hypothetical protein LBMAG09_03180 [Actinomycetes bacterium]